MPGRGSSWTTAYMEACADAEVQYRLSVANQRFGLGPATGGSRKKGKEA